MAERSLEIAKAYVSDREAFGSKLSDKQSLRHRVAEAEIELHAIRTMVRHAARQITEGNEARTEVAMSKVYAARRVNEILDEALQMCGGNGIARDLPISYFYENARPFRIVDGADEVHLRSVAREAFENVDYSEVEHITSF
jgi:acyl-CoA dehydrogenase